MNGISDQYFSRLLSVVRQNERVKFIKDIKDNKIEVEFSDGTNEWLNFESIINHKSHSNEAD